MNSLLSSGHQPELDVTPVLILLQANWY